MDTAPIDLASGAAREQPSDAELAKWRDLADLMGALVLWLASIAFIVGHHGAALATGAVGASILVLGFMLFPTSGRPRPGPW